MEPENIQFNDIKNKDSYIQAITFVDSAGTTTLQGCYVLTARQIALEIIGVLEKHTVAGTDVGAVTLDVVKVLDGSAISTGITMLKTPFNLKSTANTSVYKEGVDLSTAAQIRYLQIGESVAFKVTGVLTALAGVHVCIYYKPVNNGSYR